MTVCSGQSTIAAVRSCSISVLRDWGAPTHESSFGSAFERRAPDHLKRWLVKVMVDGEVVIDLSVGGSRRGAVEEVLKRQDLPRPALAMFLALLSGDLKTDNEDASADVRFGS